MPNKTPNLTSEVVECAREAHEDLLTLADALGWMRTLFESVSDCAERKDLNAEIRAIRVGELAAIGRHLSCDWQGTAESMAKNFAGKGEVELRNVSLKLTARAFAASAHEPEHA